MKEITAETSLDVWVQCPYCNHLQCATSKLKPLLDEDLRATNLEREIKCESKFCKETFMVTEITY